MSLAVICVVSSEGEERLYRSEVESGGKRAKRTRGVQRGRKALCETGLAAIN